MNKKDIIVVKYYKKIKVFFKNHILPFIIILFMTFLFVYIFISLGFENIEKKTLNNKSLKNNKLTSNNNKLKTVTPKSIEITKIKKNYTELKSSINEYLSNQEGIYSVYFEDIITKENFGINDSLEFTAASTTKLPLNYMLHKYYEDGKIDLTSSMTYLSSDYESGTGTIQTHEVGSTYTLEELSELSITVSDNIATNMLFRALGGATACRNYYKSIGGKVINLNKNTSCTKDMGHYLNLVYDYSITNPKYGSKLIKYLQNTIFNDRIPKYLPENIKIAHKIGSYELNCHDVGIVYTKNPYIICVFSNNGISLESEGSVIAKISKLIYDFHED
ncbi:MAG: serine hydrolase [Clostridiales bacterium]